MPVAAPNFQTLEAALDKLGKAWVLVGDFTTAGSLSVLGLTEGTITASMSVSKAERTYPEQTGDAVWDVRILGFKVSVEIPLIEGDPDIYAKVAPMAVAHGGSLTPQTPTYTSLVLVPESEFADGLEVTAGNPPVWVKPVGGTKHAVWIPKGYFEGKFPQFVPISEGVSKGTGSVTFHGVMADSADIPDDCKAWIIGDPIAAGVTALAI